MKDMSEQLYNRLNSISEGLLCYYNKPYKTKKSKHNKSKNKRNKIQKKMKGGDDANDVTSPDSLGSTVVESGNRLALGALKAVAKTIDTAIPVINEAIFGDLVDKPWEEVSPELIDKLKKDKVFLEKVLNDPELREAVTELIVEYSKLIQFAYEESKPTLFVVVDDMLNTLSEVAERSAVGVVNTVLNTAEAAIGEIPAVGGVVDLVLTIMRSINYVVSASTPVILIFPLIIV